MRSLKIFLKFFYYLPLIAIGILGVYLIVLGDLITHKAYMKGEGGSLKGGRGKIIRINRLPNEARAYVILRRKGQSINNIAKVFGRSTSFVYRIIKFNRGLGITRKDLRKLPRILRLRFASRMRFLLISLYRKWEKFILGESEKPP